MKSFELRPGTVYLTTAAELPRVKFREIFEQYEDGAALVSVEHGRRLYLMGADQLIRAA